MSVLETLVETLKEMPYEQQKELLHYAEFLNSKKKANGNPPRKSLYGLWANRGIDITEEDIDEIRREMWGNFPREDI
ncbi:MAG: DUF2281 domain-containing protein [Pyrinomonadaceae bacterium]